MITIKDDTTQLSISPDIEERPWVLLFNRYFGPRKTLHLFINPFPWEFFPPNSPWKDNVVLAWNDSTERLAKREGYISVPAYIADEIKKSVYMHGKF